MTGSNDVAWEPQPLPEVLTEQLRSHGFEPSDSAEVARQIGETVGPAASASLFVDLGACNFLDGDIDGAIATWRRAVASGQVTPGARALLNLGLLYEHLHLHDRAISVLRSAVERQAEPFATEASIAEARCHCAKGDHSTGLATLARLTESLIVNQPRSGLLGYALLQLGDVARSAGRPDRAERAWKAAASTHLPEVENTANEKLISLLVDLGRDDEARQVIDESTTSRASLTAAQRLDRAELLIDLGRSENAIELLATVRGDQLSTSERFRLAEVLLSQGLINESIDHLESLIELPLVDHRMRARYALAEVYRLHGMTLEAEDMYQSVIEGEHRYWSPKAGLQLGDLHEDRDDIEGAVGLWVRAASSPVQEVREDAEARLTDRVTTSLALARDDAEGDQDDDDQEGDDTAESSEVTTFSDQVMALADDVAGDQADANDNETAEADAVSESVRGPGWLVGDLDDADEPGGADEPDAESDSAAAAPAGDIAAAAPVGDIAAAAPVGDIAAAAPVGDIAAAAAPDDQDRVAPMVAPQPAFVAPIPQAPPKVIPLRAANFSGDIVPPASVEVGAVPVAPPEPLVVALGVGRVDDAPSSHTDPFSELAPPDARELSIEARRGPSNPYAELAPANLVAESNPPIGVVPEQLDLGVGQVSHSAPVVQPAPAPPEPIVPVAEPAKPIPGQTSLPIDVPGALPFKGASPADELRWRGDGANRDERYANRHADDAGSERESSGFFSQQLDD